jgi:hypothetical protein
MALAIVLLQIACCLGFGALVLKGLRLSSNFSAGEEGLFSFAIGFGVLGWLVFPLGIAGLLADGWLLGLLLLGLPGLLILRIPTQINHRPDLVGWLLISLIGVAAVFDIAEALAPPGDADTLAYHFNVPKLFLQAGVIEFILRPIDGSVPYLVQMTYLPVLGLGGERALTLWTMISGWAAAGLLFILCRHHLSRNWSLAVTAIFFTTPIVVYAAGTGQIEIRTAMFVMVGAWAIAKSIETDKLAFSILAGLVVGYYGGSKYIGLLFAVAGGLAILMQRRWLIHGLVYTITACVIGSQWYIWNAIHTGDPFFPMLFQWLGRDDLLLWTKDHDLLFKATYFPLELPAPRSILWFFLYPFSATLDSFPVFESKRAGFGPYGLILLPFALMGIWKFKDRILKSRLWVYALITVIFYGLWFFSGSSQRIRLISPVLPLFLLCITVAAQRSTSHPAVRSPLIAGIAATLILHIAGSTVFSLKYLRFVSNPESRESFLNNNVSKYAFVPWVNSNLTANDKLLTADRQHLYHLKVPTFFISPHTQTAINLYRPTQSAKVAHSQLMSVGITHVVLFPILQNSVRKYNAPFGALYSGNCLELVKSFDVKVIDSRTIPSARRPKTMGLDLLRLKSNSCLLN